MSCTLMDPHSLSNLGHCQFWGLVREAQENIQSSIHSTHRFAHDQFTSSKYLSTILTTIIYPCTNSTEEISCQAKKEIRPVDNIKMSFYSIFIIIINLANQNGFPHIYSVYVERLERSTNSLKGRL